jgi:hypothetical protein
MNGSLVLLDRAQGLSSMARLQGLIPGPGEHATREVPYRFFVVNHQDGMAAWWSRRTRRWGARVLAVHGRS